MRIILQRVTASSISLGGETVGSIGRGYNLLLGITASDSETELDWLANKCLNLEMGNPRQVNRPQTYSTYIFTRSI